MTLIANSTLLFDRALAWGQAMTHGAGWKDIFWTIGLLAAASLAARIQSKRIGRDSHASLEEKRQSRANFRNGLMLATIAMLLFVWGGELRPLILSLAAIAAAIMIVSKELISCFYGAIVFTLSKPARIGDAIEVGAHKGELLDHNWFSLTLMELSDTHYYSGKIIKIPNSALLATPLVNLSQGGGYRFSTLLFHARQENAMEALSIAQAAAVAVCSEWTEDARASLDVLRVSYLTHAPDVEPKATLVSIDKDSLAVSLRFPVPSARRAAAQAAISKLYFEGMQAHLKDEKIKDRQASAGYLATAATAGASASGPASFGSLSAPGKSSGSPSPAVPMPSVVAGLSGPALSDVGSRPTLKTTNRPSAPSSGALAP